MPNVAADTTGESIINKITEIVVNPDLYDRGTRPPSPQAIANAKNLLAEASFPDWLPKAEVGVFHGELDVTWHHNGRIVRLMLHSNGRTPSIYFCKPYATKKEDEARFVNAGDSTVLSSSFRWLEE